MSDNPQNAPKVAEFDIDNKVIGIPRRDGQLINQTVVDFVDEVSRDTPAPGGGSISALAGAVGVSLASMVAVGGINSIIRRQSFRSDNITRQEWEFLG